MKTHVISSQFLGIDKVEKIIQYEAAMLAYMRSEHKALLDRINEKGDYNDEIETAIRTALDEFKEKGTW